MTRAVQGALVAALVGISRLAVVGARLPRRRAVCRHGWLTGPGPRACTAGCNHGRNR